jgi:tRNA-2-methylthio-N6-dimethylallyladenosine synthase
MIYIGMYSPRPGTYGARKYEDNVPQTLKKDRHARLNDLLIKISDENNKKEIGTWREMMVRDIQDRAFI